MTWTQNIARSCQNDQVIGIPSRAVLYAAIFGSLQKTLGVFNRPPPVHQRLLRYVGMVYVYPLLFTALEKKILSDLMCIIFRKNQKPHTSGYSNLHFVAHSDVFGKASTKIFSKSCLSLKGCPSKTIIRFKYLWNLFYKQDLEHFRTCSSVIIWSHCCSRTNSQRSILTYIRIKVFSVARCTLVVYHWTLLDDSM